MAKLNGGQSLPMLCTRGSHYDIGYAIGSTFRDKIHQFCQNSTLVTKGLIPFYDCQAGRSIYASYFKNATESFPEFVREIRGMADGCGMKFENIFLLNMAKEVYNYHFNEVFGLKKGEGGIWGCTVGYINNFECKILAHNEDCDPEVKNYGFLVQAQIEDPDVPGDGEKFTAYSYPGSLCGNTFSFNRHGMIFTCNGLYPKLAMEGATPRYFLNRAILRAQSFAEAESIARNRGFGSAFGFCTNMASVKHPEKMCAMEVAPGTPESQVAVKYIDEQNEKSLPCHYIHINNYKLMEIEEFEFMDSSNARTKRASEFPDPKKLFDLKQILGDTKNTEYPIFRTPRPTDDSETVCTAIFDIMQKKMDVFVDNVKTDCRPLVTLPIF